MRRSRFPARRRPTPRGIAGRRVSLIVEPIVEKHVPPARLSDCIQRHRGGARVALAWAGQREDVFRSKCIHRGFEWWLVEFPSQRKMFAGPPEFFAGLPGGEG